MKTLKNTVAALILVAFTGTSLFAQQGKDTKSKKEDKKAAAVPTKKNEKKKDMAVKGEGVSSKTKSTTPAAPASVGK
ncbi:MAG TPA: hypothetical protein VK806_05340 [Bacteroidia bacterium]|jgi:hypothetical protein|nr:hypothetical protein [Bacteroidia bacterium]